MLLALSLLATPAWAQDGEPVIQQDRLVILHTNDWQSRLLPFGPNADYTEGVGDDDTIGGIARMKSLVDRERAAAAERGVPLLLVAALFHSPFGFLPVLLLGLGWLPLFWRRFTFHWAAAINLVLLLAPVSIFTQRLSNDTLMFKLALLRDIEPASASTSFLTYLLLLPLVDMAGIPLLLLLLISRQ